MLVYYLLLAIIIIKSYYSFFYFVDMLYDIWMPQYAAAYYFSHVACYAMIYTTIIEAYSLICKILFYQNMLMSYLHSNIFCCSCCLLFWLCLYNAAGYLLCLMFSWRCFMSECFVCLSLRWRLKTWHHLHHHHHTIYCHCILMMMIKFSLPDMYHAIHADMPSAVAAIYDEERAELFI